MEEDKVAYGPKSLMDQLSDNDNQHIGEVERVIDDYLESHFEGDSTKVVVLTTVSKKAANTIMRWYKSAGWSSESYISPLAEDRGWIFTFIP